MKFAFKKIVKRVNVLKSLHKIIAYVLIFSLLWQNSLWAMEGISILQENLEAARARTYNSRRIGIVEPGTIRDNEIHNVFQDLQLLEGGGLVFKGSPNTSKIYNRIYSANPVQLSGVMEADYPLPMVFVNPGGMVLENPDFQNIHDLTLAAGSLAQTNKGMAYRVDEGSLTINKTFIQEVNDIKNLSLAGGGIRVNQSFLSPSESLILRAGQHVKGWNRDGEWVSEDDIEPNESSLSDHCSIFLDDSTILRSKGLFFESLDPGTSIHANGLLHSTEGDIVIHARGDVYLNQLCAHRNLDIETTGKVFLGNQTFFGGSVKIKAAEILNQGKLIGTGKITFDAPWSRNNSFIKTQGLFDTKTFLNEVQGRIEAKSLAHPLAFLSSNLGSVEIQDDLILNATAETLKGTIKTHGKVEVGGQELILDGNICAQNGFDFKGLKKFTNKQNSTLSAFGAGFQGTLKEFENEGKIDLSLTNAWIGNSTNKKTGIIRTRGHSILKGNHHFNYGTIFTCGVHHTTLTGTYKDNGTFYSPTVFLLEAQEINFTDSHKSFLKDGVISARSDLNAGAQVFFELKGNMNPCFLQLNSQQNLKFKGEIRQFSSNSGNFPILDYFKVFNQAPVSPETFKNEMALLSLKSWEKTRPSRGSAITLQAGGDMNYDGATISQESGSVNLFAKNKVCTKNTNIKAGYFNGDSTKITCNTAILDNTKLKSLFGDTSLIAQENATLNNCHLQGGLSAHVISQNVWMDESTVRSTHGAVGVYGSQAANLKHSSVQAKSVASVTGGKSATLQHSSLEGQHTIVNGGKRLTLSHNDVKGQYNSFTAKHIKADSNRMNGPALFSANNSLKIHDLNATGTVTTFAPTSKFSGTSTADSLTVQSKVINQLGVIKTVKDTCLEASECYVDNGTSHNEAGGNLSLIAPETNGFKGTQKAGDTLEVVLKDMNILDLLSQTQARLTKAHLLEGEVRFDEDLIIDRTLHLWAKSLENKAKFTSTKDFIAHMQTLIMNEGSMISQGNMTLESQGTVFNAGDIKATNLNVKGKTVINESQVTQQGIYGGYAESLTREATMGATTGNLNVEATECLYARGSKFEAKLNINLKSVGKLYLGAQALCSEVTHSDRDSSYHRYTRYHHKSQVNAGGNVDIWSGEGMIFEGVDVAAAGYIHAKSEDTLENRTVHNLFHEEIKTESDGGFFGGKKTESTQTTNDTVVRNVFKAGKDLRLESEKDNIQQAPHIESGGKTSILSHQGKVYIKADKSSYMTSTQSSSKSLVWQSQEQKGRYDEAVVMLEILAKGGIHISGKQGIEAEIGQNHRASHSYAWIEELRKDPTVTWRTLSEEHKEWHQEVQGLTGPAAAVIALAISVVTAGTGATLAGFAAASAQGAMASAAFTSLVTQASLSLINNQGDMGKVFKELGSKEFLQSLATSVATSGATQGLSNQFKVSSQAMTFSEHLQKNAIKSFVNAGASIAQGGKPLEALSRGLINIVVDSAAGMAANNIGTAYSNGTGNGDLNWGTHKLLHGILGAGMSAGKAAFLKQNPEKAALTGGVGAMFAETLAEATRDALGTQKAANFGILATAATALFTKQDVDVAVSTGTNAIENNFLSIPPESPIAPELIEGVSNILEDASSFLGTEITTLKEMKDTINNRNEAEIKATEQELKNPNLSFFEKISLNNYRDALIENRKCFAQMPETKGDLVLLGSIVLPVLKNVVQTVRGVKIASPIGKELHLAHKIARENKGTITEIKAGYKIEIPHNNDTIVVRIMESGGQRSTPYYRVSIPGKETFTRTGEVSTLRELTHIDLSQDSYKEIMNIINKISK